MPTADLSGVEKVEIDVAGNNFAAALDLGRIDNETSGFEPILPDNAQDTALNTFHLGSVMNPTVIFTDTSHLPALQQHMENDDRMEVRITFFNGKSITLENYIRVRQLLRSSAENHMPGELTIREYKVTGGHYPS